MIVTVDPTLASAYNSRKTQKIIKTEENNAAWSCWLKIGGPTIFVNIEINIISKFSEKKTRKTKKHSDFTFEYIIMKYMLETFIKNGELKSNSEKWTVFNKSETFLQKKIHLKERCSNDSSRAAITIHIIG